MTAATETRLTEARVKGEQHNYKMAASQQIFGGTMVMLNSAGLAVPAVAAAGNKGVVGRATRDVLSTTAGEEITVEEGEFLFDAVSILEADIGDVMFALDDSTFDETQLANQPQAGKLTRFESTTSGWVKIGLALAS